MLKRLLPEQRAAYGWGIAVAVIAATLILSPGLENWHAAGPHNVGHTKIDCAECHTRSDGNVIGQAFGNIVHAVGFTDSAPYFVFTPADNEQCIACHDSPDNRHPADDYVSPEFDDARLAAGVHLCTSCHEQHLGTRVSAAPTVCQHCHINTEGNPCFLSSAAAQLEDRSESCKFERPEDDPVDVAHTELIAGERWETCLGCHDFHGNHEREVPVLLADRLSETQIREYLDGGASPYGRRQLTAIQTLRSRRRGKSGEQSE